MMLKISRKADSTVAGGGGWAGVCWGGGWGGAVGGGGLGGKGGGGGSGTLKHCVAAPMPEMTSTVVESRPITVAASEDMETDHPGDYTRGLTLSVPCVQCRLSSGSGTETGDGVSQSSDLT